MNQKLDHQNPDFYFGLFKEFLKHYPNLTSLERDCINERMKEFLCYVNKKRYKNRVELKNDLYSLMPNPTNTLEFHSYFDARYIDPFKNDVLRYNRVNLTKEYLEKLHKQIEEMQEEYYQKYQIVLKEEELANYFQCPIYDIQNSQYIASTFCLEGQKYAFSYGYDHEYNTYLRIHVFDTTFISEDSDLYREMQNHKKGKSKAVHYILSFKKGERTPAFTYQLKILKNGCVSSFKMYESTIKVDRVIKNKEWLRYREDATLKQFVGILNQLAIEYNLEEPFLNHQSMEQMIDAVLNIEIKRLIEKVDLPTLYQIHKDRNEEDMIKEYSKVCHYLKNLTKSEVEEFYNLFLHSKTYQFYATTPMYESHIFLDTSSFLGYLELQVLASYSKNVPVTEITKKYLSTFKELEQNLNEEDVYMSYKTQKYLEKVR